jgi:hypothetical protein
MNSTSTSMNPRKVNELRNELKYINAFKEIYGRRVTCLSKVRGVYPVIKKWHLGVGMREAINPMRSLFMYPGYLNVVVLAAMTVDTFTFTQPIRHFQ